MICGNLTYLLRTASALCLTWTKSSNKEYQFQVAWPSLSSPMAAIADPLEYVVDREIIRLYANRFFFVALASFSSCNWLTHENNRPIHVHLGALDHTPVCIQGPQATPHVHPGGLGHTHCASGDPRLYPVLHTGWDDVSKRSIACTYEAISSPHISAYRVATQTLEAVVIRILSKSLTLSAPTTSNMASM